MRVRSEAERADAYGAAARDFGRELSDQPPWIRGNALYTLVHMSMHMPVHMSMHIPVHVPMHMLVHMSIHMSIRMPVHISIHMPAHMFVHPSTEK